MQLCLVKSISYPILSYFVSFPHSLSSLSIPLPDHKLLALASSPSLASSTFVSASALASASSGPRAVTYQPRNTDTYAEHERFLERKRQHERELITQQVVRGTMARNWSRFMADA